MNRQEALWLIRSIWATTDDPTAVLSCALDYGFSRKDIEHWPAAEYSKEVGRLNDPPPRPIGRGWTLDHKASKQTCRSNLIPPALCASRENLQWLKLEENIEKGTNTDDPETIRWIYRHRSPRLLRS